jgi:hypothetical protein
MSTVILLTKPSCNHADRLHYERHKEILTIVREIKTLDGADSTSNTCLIKRRSSAGAKEEESLRRPVEATAINHNKDYVDDGLRRRERKSAKKLGRCGKEDLKVFGHTEIDDISQALHLVVHESKGARCGTYAYDDRRHEPLTNDVETRKEENEEESHACTVQPPTPVSKKAFLRPKYATPKEQGAVQRISTTTPFKTAKHRGNSQRFNPNASSKSDPYGGVDPAIFSRLKIDVSPTHNSKARKELVRRLAVAIKNDFAILRQDEAESARREEGFWRWAGRAAFRNIMTCHRESFDWATGEKIVKRTPLTEEEIFGEEMDKDDGDELGAVSEDQVNDTLEAGARARSLVEGEGNQGEDNKGKEKEITGMDTPVRDSRVGGVAIRDVEMNLPEPTQDRSKETRSATKQPKKKAWIPLAYFQANQGSSDWGLVHPVPELAPRNPK